MPFHPPIEMHKTGQRRGACGGAIERFVAGIRDLVVEALGCRLRGIVLHGSPATGAFHPPKSDVDLIVVSLGALDDTQRWALWRGLLRLSDARPIIGDIELSVIRAEIAARPCHPVPSELHFSADVKAAIRAGTMRHAPPALNEDLAAHLTLAPARGVSLLGSDPAVLFGPVPHRDYLASILADLDWLIADEHIVETPFYAVLNICRILQVIETGEGSAPDKEEGALWALERLPGEHHGLIRLALAVYRSEAPLPDRAAATRRQGGVAWPRDALLCFRDFARSHRQ